MQLMGDKLDFVSFFESLSSKYKVVSKRFRTVEDGAQVVFDSDNCRITLTEYTDVSIVHYVTKDYERYVIECFKQDAIDRLKERRSQANNL